MHVGHALTTVEMHHVLIESSLPNELLVAEMTNEERHGRLHTDLVHVAHVRDQVVLLQQQQAALLTLELAALPHDGIVLNARVDVTNYRCFCSGVSIQHQL